MRRILAVSSMVVALATIPTVAIAKPYGYLGNWRSPASNMDHHERKASAVATFRSTVTNPVDVGNTATPALPARPAKSHR